MTCMTDRPPPPRCEVIAHRGSCTEAPENTWAAIERAIARRADRIELDVQELADGSLAILHDTDLRRLTGCDRPSWELAAADLATIDVGAWFGPAFAGERIPLLGAVLAGTAHRVALNLELKAHGHEQAIVSRVAAVLREAAAVSPSAETDRWVVTSFRHDWLHELRAIAPEIPLGSLWGPGSDPAEILADCDRHAWHVLSLHESLVDPCLAKSLRDRGQAFWVWTVDEAIAATRLRSLGAAGIITNRPNFQS